MGQGKYLNNTHYLINLYKNNLKLIEILCTLQLKISKTQKWSDLMNTALTEVHCVKTKKVDIQTFTCNKCIYAATFLIIRGISMQSSSISTISNSNNIIAENSWKLSLEDSLYSLVSYSAALLQAKRKNCFVPYFYSTNF